MWIFTTKGFISAVEWKGSPGFMCVRARQKSHLAALFPELQIIENIDADYRYRAKVPRVLFEQSMLYEMREIAYPDFKSELQDDAYHSACSRVWEVMHALQPKPPRKQKPLWPPGPEQSFEDFERTIPW